jgi:hypothetical protein
VPARRVPSPAVGARARLESPDKKKFKNKTTTHQKWRYFNATTLFVLEKKTRQRPARSLAALRWLLLPLARARRLSTSIMLFTCARAD